MYLDAFHQKCLRQLLGIRWYDRIVGGVEGICFWLVRPSVRACALGWRHAPTFAVNF